MINEVKHTLIYVDRALAIAIAAKLVGVLRTRSAGSKTTAGVNWLVSAQVEDSAGTSEQADIREMLPEDLMHYIYPQIGERYDKLDSVLTKLATGTKDSLIPGDVVSISGKLHFPQLASIGSYSPFQDIDVDLPSVQFHGEACLVAELKDESYILPVFLSEVAKYQVSFCHDQPVEITGIVRWTPPYSPGGAHALNLALRGAAVWLR